MKIKPFLISFGLLGVASSACAADFFSTAAAPQLLNLGVRVGINTSNRTLSDHSFPDCYHRENWGTGFDLGVVADINFRDYFALQPGVFFEGRLGSYTIMGSAAGSALPDDGSTLAQAGTRRSFNFTIPLLASFRFNVSDDLRWIAEAGPYVAFCLSSHVSVKSMVVDGTAGQPLFRQKAAPVDFGFKIGTGLQVLDHYYVGVHYLAGCLDAWKDTRIHGLSKSYGGVTKEWMFTLGYDF